MVYLLYIGFAHLLMKFIYFTQKIEIQMVGSVVSQNYKVKILDPPRC